MILNKLSATEWLVPGATAVVMAAVVWFGTPWGLGLSPDSVSYLTSARALAESGSLNQLPTHWPPFFTMILALGKPILGDIILFSRWLHAFVVALNVILLFTLLKKADLPRHLIYLLLVLLILQPGFLNIHLLLWTEPLFLCLALSNLLILERTLFEQRNTNTLVILGLVAGAAIMVRYAGLFLLVVNGLACLSFIPGEKPFSRRISAAIVVTFLTLLPMSAWVVFNCLRGSGATNRELHWHPFGLPHLEQATDTLASWFHLPTEFGWVVLIVLIGGAIIVLVMGWYSQFIRKDFLGQQVMPSLLALYLLTYSVFLVLSISLVDYHTPLDQRILIPIFPVGVLLFLHGAQKIHHLNLRLIIIGAVMLGLIPNISQSYRIWEGSRVKGTGFASQQLQASQIMSVINQLPKDFIVSTNSPEIFQLYLDQVSKMLPARLSPTTQRPNPEYGNQIEIMKKEADAIVFFTSMSYRYYLPNAEEINDHDGFRLVYAKPDGAVWVRDEKK